jgi:RecJ-like exonuclease
MAEEKITPNSKAMELNAVLPAVKLGKEKVTCEDCCGTGHVWMDSKGESDFMECPICDGTGNVSIKENIAMSNDNLNCQV